MSAGGSAFCHLANIEAVSRTVLLKLSALCKFYPIEEIEKILHLDGNGGVALFFLVIEIKEAAFSDFKVRLIAYTIEVGILKKVLGGCPSGYAEATNFERCC